MNQDQTPEPDRDRIVPLTEADLPALRMHLHSRLHEEEARRLVRLLPGLSQWHPASGEYVLIAPWRHRTDIISLREVSTFHHESDLLAAAFAAADEQGLLACITAETFERRRPVFYSRNGMAMIETIIAYHHDQASAYLDAVESPVQQFVHVTLDDHELLQQVIATDHAAFSWMWHNSPGEFFAWMSNPSVEVWAGMIDGRVASYFGTTYFTSMGHLDRIAVHPDFQGQRLGQETLAFALQRMAQTGLNHGALSTQLGNEVSKRLYDRAGFHRSTKDDYHMYGTLLSAAPKDMEQE